MVLFAACSDPSDKEHTDASYLVGTWEKDNGAASFEIFEDYAFECFLVNVDPVATAPSNYKPALIGGRLSFDNSQGPNDYFMRDLITVNPGIYTGNTIVNQGLPMMQNQLITLTPNSGKTTFVFSAEGNQLANAFFGGTFIKQQ
jgi:hypothetical protein